MSSTKCRPVWEITRIRCFRGVRLLSTPACTLLSWMVSSDVNVSKFHNEPGWEGIWKAAFHSITEEWWFSHPLLLGHHGGSNHLGKKILFNIYTFLELLNNPFPKENNSFREENFFFNMKNKANADFKTFQWFCKWKLVLRFREQNTENAAHLVQPHMEKKCKRSAMCLRVPPVQTSFWT